MRIEGLVDSECEFDFAALSALPGQVDDVSSLVPGREGRAVRLESVLEAAGPREAASHITIESEDGTFSACVPLASIRDEAVLLYAYDGAPLPPGKGGPVRMLIPETAACDTAEIDNCVNVKFVGRLSLTDRAVEDTRPTTADDHAALHAQPGHEHLSKDD